MLAEAFVLMFELCPSGCVTNLLGLAHSNASGWDVGISSGGKGVSTLLLSENEADGIVIKNLQAQISKLK